MNKKIIAVAIAAAIAAPMSASAASNQVTVYGKVHVTVDYADKADPAGDELNVVSRASRIGFKGHEDLGNGIKAIWKAESTFDFADGTGFVNPSRNTYIGLAGGFGTFVIGRHDTPYKMATGKLDMFVDTMADFNATIGFEDVRTSQTIAYISPSLSGVSFSGALVTPAKDGLAPNSAKNNEKDINAYSLAVVYKGGPAFASLAFENGNELAGFTEEKWKIGLGISMAGFTLNGIYEDVKNSFGTTADGDRWQLQAGYKMGSSTLKAMYGEASKELGSREAWSVGYDYNMSKRTRLYALYVDHQSNVSGADFDGFSLGMIHKF